MVAMQGVGFVGVLRLEGPMIPLSGIEGSIELVVGRRALMEFLDHASERAMCFVGSKEGIWGC
jgi:hypothetical protein